jgi:hypothetical protein
MNEYPVSISSARRMPTSATDDDKDSKDGKIIFAEKR